MPKRGPTDSPSRPGDESTSLVNVTPGRGAYQTAQDVSLMLAPVSAGEALPESSDDWQIRFTLDGSEPAADRGQAYQDRISIEANTILRAAAFAKGEATTEIATHSYLFPGSTLAQPNRPGEGRGFPDFWGEHDGEPVKADYGMDSRPLKAEGNREDALRSLAELPSVSLALAPAALFNADTGIYANPIERGRDWERAVSVELIDPKGEEPGFQVDAGLRIHGNMSRIPTETAKHSLRLKFRSEYGPAKLDYPLFDESPIDRFDSLVLRAMVNDSFLVNGEKAQYLRDAWLRETERLMGLRTAHGRFVHLYISGLYWGLYDLSERLDEDFAADYWGGKGEEYDVISPDGANSGDMDAWEETLRMAEAGLESREAYEAIAERIDIVAFIDHWILGQIAARPVWPIANWSAIRSRSPDGKFRFPGWDAEHGMVDIDLDRSKSAKDGTPAQLYSRLRRNEEFQRLFGDRVHKHLFGAMEYKQSLIGGLLYSVPSELPFESLMWEFRNPPAVRYAALAAQIEDAVIVESARWGDWEHPDAPPHDRDRNWIPTRDFLLNSYFARRRLVVLDQFRERGLYPEVDAPVFHWAQGRVTPINRAEGGTFFCRGDGGDPRLAWEGTLAPEAQVLQTAGVPFVDGALVSLTCRARSKEGWSALVEYRENQERLRISELMYHPADDGDAEFIELANTSKAWVNVGGYGLNGGIDFRFPEPTWIEPEQRMVLVADPVAFSNRYPDVAITGRYVGRLSNQGESIRLFNSEGRNIETIDYADTAPWPELADGGGASLEPAVGLTTPSSGEPEQWKASASSGGSPGR
jgi:hypothetical protein